MHILLRFCSLTFLYLDNHLVDSHIFLKRMGYWNRRRSCESNSLRPFWTWNQSQVLRRHADTVPPGLQCYCNVCYLATPVT